MENGETEANYVTGLQSWGISEMWSPKSILWIQSPHNRAPDSQILASAPSSIAETLREVSKHRLLKNDRLVPSQVPTSTQAPRTFC